MGLLVLLILPVLLFDVIFGVFYLPVDRAFTISLIAFGITFFFFASFSLVILAFDEIQHNRNKKETLSWFIPFEILTITGTILLTLLLFKCLNC